VHILVIQDLFNTLLLLKVNCRRSKELESAEHKKKDLLWKDKLERRKIEGRDRKVSNLKRGSGKPHHENRFKAFKKESLFNKRDKVSFLRQGKNY